MDVNFEIMKNAFPLLIAGAGITIEITALSVFFGMLIGVVVSLVRLSDFKILRWLGNVYVDFIRGTPLLIQIFLVYFALPSIIGHRVDAFFAASPHVLLTAERMWQKYSGEVSSPLTKGRWKRAAVWV